MNITDFKSGNVAGFDLAGWRLKDGTFKLHGSEDIIPEFPPEVECNGDIFTLEEVVDCGKVDDPQGMFVNVVYA